MTKFRFFISALGLMLTTSSWSQILPSLPANGDTLQEQEPNLVWQCLTPYLGDPRYSLTLTVAQMDQNQTALDAVVSNVPVLFRENLTQNAFTLSASQVTLLEDVWYAWQVTLLYNNVPLQQSEPFKFIISVPEPPKPVMIALRKSADNSIFSVNTPKLHLTTQDPGTFQTQARLVNENNSVVTCNLTQIPGNTDLRVWEIDLQALNLDEGQYRLEWQASKNCFYTISIEL